MTSNRDTTKGKESLMTVLHRNCLKNDVTFVVDAAGGGVVVAGTMLVG
ncbi:MAG: hypothetical protein Q8P01_03170 [bacterium]|nr:hypothetical protein [bacterium]